MNARALGIPFSTTRIIDGAQCPARIWRLVSRAHRVLCTPGRQALARMAAPVEALEFWIVDRGEPHTIRVRRVSQARAAVIMINSAIVRLVDFCARYRWTLVTV